MVQPRPASQFTSQLAPAYPRSPVQLRDARPRAATGGGGEDDDPHAAVSSGGDDYEQAEEKREEEDTEAWSEAEDTEAWASRLVVLSGVLSGVPLLGALSMLQLSRILSVSERKTVPRYGAVLRRGSPCSGLLVLLDGRVRCTSADADAPILLVASGAVLGLQSWSTATPERCEHTAADACTVLRIPGWALQGLPLQGLPLQQQPPQQQPPQVPRVITAPEASSALAADSSGSGSGSADAPPQPPSAAPLVPHPPQTAHPAGRRSSAHSAGADAPFDPFVHVEAPPPPPPPLFGPGIERLHTPQLPPLLMHSARSGGHRDAPFGASASVSNGGRHAPFGGAGTSASGAQTSRPASSAGAWRPEGPREFSLHPAEEGGGGGGKWGVGAKWEVGAKPIWDRRRKEALLASQRVLRPSGTAQHQSCFASEAMRPSVPSTPQGHGLLDAIAKASHARSHAPPSARTATGCASPQAHRLGKRQLVIPWRKGRGKGLEVEARELSWTAVDITAQAAAAVRRQRAVAW